MNFKNVKGVIFDLDGTLIDSMFLWEELGCYYLVNKGLRPEENINMILKTMSMTQAAEYFQKKYGISDSADTIIEDIKKIIKDYYFNIIKIKPGIMNILSKIQNNKIKMLIVTANERDLTEAVLKRNNINRYFSGIITSREAGYGKDTPIIFDKACEYLKIPKDKIVVFDDALYAAQSAKKAGLKVIGVYDVSSCEDKQKMIDLCDDYIVSYDDWSELNL